MTEKLARIEHGALAGFSSPQELGAALVQNAREAEINRKGNALKEKIQSLIRYRKNFGEQIKSLQQACIYIDQKLDAIESGAFDYDERTESLVFHNNEFNQSHRGYFGDTLEP